MSLTFKSLGIDDYLEQSTTGTTTSYTFDINNSSGTTAGDSGFMIVMGSWNTTADVSTLFQTSFLDSSGNIISTRYRTTSTNTTSTRASYQKSFSTAASNNYFQPHNMSSASSTAFDGERHHFMFHISFNPQTSSSGQPMGYLHCSGHYIVTENSGNIVIGYCDQVAIQKDSTNKIEQMKIQTSSGFMTNLRVKVYRLGAR